MNKERDSIMSSKSYSKNKRKKKSNHAGALSLSTAWMALNLRPK
jgi:hypothetical protein